MSIAIPALPFGICLVILGWYLWKGLRSGELMIGGEDGPAVLITKTKKPKRYWAIIAFWGGLTAITAVKFVLVILGNSN